MKKILTATMAALTLGGAVLSTATPAAAHDWEGHGGYHQDWRGDRGDDAGAAIAGGIVGLALGAALTSHSNYYDRSYSGSDYYRSGYYGGSYDEPGYATCVSRRTVWDPYYGRYVVRTFRHAC